MPYATRWPLWSLLMSSSSALSLLKRNLWDWLWAFHKRQLTAVKCHPFCAPQVLFGAAWESKQGNEIPRASAEFKSEMFLKVDTVLNVRTERLIWALVIRANLSLLWWKNFQKCPPFMVSIFMIISQRLRTRVDTDAEHHAVIEDLQKISEEETVVCHVETNGWSPRCLWPNCTKWVNYCNSTLITF